MSLLLFFHPSPVINHQGDLTPAVIQQIVTVRPTMYYVEKSQGQFITSTIQYSSSSNQYNSGLYGGQDRLLGQAPILYSIDSIRPKLYKLSKL